MNKTYKNGITFVIYTFWALSCFVAAIIGVVDPNGTMDVLRLIPWFSWMGALGYAVHVFGNLLMASVALLFAFRNLSK